MLKSYLEFCCKGFIAPQVLGRRHTSTKNVSGLSLLIVSRQIDCLWKSSGPRNAIRSSHRKQCWIGQRKHAYSQSNWASWWWNFEADPIRLLAVNHFGKQNSGSGCWKFVKLKRTQISLRARKQRKKTNWLQSSWIKVHFEKRRGMKWRTVVAAMVGVRFFWCHVGSRLLVMAFLGLQRGIKAVDFGEFHSGIAKFIKRKIASGSGSRVDHTSKFLSTYSNIIIIFLWKCLFYHIGLKLQLGLHSILGLNSTAQRTMPSPETDPF